jgi:hypothetical protein
MNPTYFTYQPRRMRDAQLVKRYVFDLNEVVGDLKTALQLSDEQTELARAWVIEHLREYHYLDVGLFNEPAQEVKAVERRCPRFVDALNRSLYRLFVNMACHTCNAEFFDLSLRHDVLQVAVYD